MIFIRLCKYKIWLNLKARYFKEILMTFWGYKGFECLVFISLEVQLIIQYEENLNYEQ